MIFATKREHLTLKTFLPQIFAALKVGLFGLREVNGWVTFENSAWTPGGLWIHLGKSRCGCGYGGSGSESEPRNRLDFLGNVLFLGRLNLYILPGKRTNVHWKSSIGRCISYWNSPFCRGDVSFRGCRFVNLWLHCGSLGKKPNVVTKKIRAFRQPTAR